MAEIRRRDAPGVSREGVVRVSLEGVAAERGSRMAGRNRWCRRKGVAGIQVFLTFETP